jgi:hypothetical protein
MMLYGLVASKKGLNIDVHHIFALRDMGVASTKFFCAVSGKGFAVAVLWSNYPATARFKK